MEMLSIVPMLVETGNFQTIVDLCLRKIRAIDQNKTEENAEDFNDFKDECYTIILQLIAAIEYSISNKSLNIMDFLASKSKATKTKKTEFEDGYIDNRN